MTRENRRVQKKILEINRTTEDNREQQRIT